MGEASASLSTLYSVHKDRLARRNTHTMTKGLKRAAKPLYDALGDNQNLTGVGSVPSAVAANIQVEEIGDDASRRTRLTLTDVPVSVVSITTGAGVGGTQVYTLPEGFIVREASLCKLSISVAAASQADFTDATPEGDMGLGTLAPVDADALGLDPTDDDWCTATPFVMAAFTDPSVDLPSENRVLTLLDGSITPIPLFVNMLVDAADINDSVTTEVLVSGTIDLLWALLGDV